MSKKAVVTATELQRASGKVLKRAAVGEEHLVIERGGYPVAVMISYTEYEQFMQERALARHRDLVMALGQEAEQQGVDEAQLMADLEAAKQEVYREKYGQ